MSASFLGLADSTFYPCVDIKLLLFYCLLLLVHSTSNIKRRFTKKKSNCTMHGHPYLSLPSTQKKTIVLHIFALFWTPLLTSFLPHKLPKTECAESMN
jgi:hypothetical protein